MSPRSPRSPVLERMQPRHRKRSAAAAPVGCAPAGADPALDARAVRSADPGERDVRRKRPPALSFLLRLDTAAARRARRLAARARPRRRLPGDLHRAAAEGPRARPRARRAIAFTRRGEFVAVRLPRHRAAVRALRAVRRPRPASRSDADRRIAVPGHVRRAAVRRRQRRAVLQLLHLLRHARLRAALRIVVPLRLRDASPARCCAPPATAAVPCSSAPASTSSTSPARSSARRTRRSTSSGSSRCSRCAPTAACARSARSTISPACSRTQRVDEVIIADPDFPQAEAVELVDQCHRRGVRVRIAPSTMEILIHRAEFVPGQSVPLFELEPAGLRGPRLRAQAHLRPDRRDAAAARAQPAAAR